MGRGPNSWKGGKLNKGAWTALEDKILRDYVTAHGDRRWNIVAKDAGLSRCAKSCRLRWLNYLRPDIKRGNITEDEEDLIIRLHKLLGNRWSLIAGRLPGRTDNEIKNYWHTNLAKKEKARRSGNATVDDRNLKVTKRAEREQPLGLLQPDITKSYRSCDINRSEDQGSELKDSKLGNDLSPTMSPEEGPGEFKAGFILEDVDLSGIEFDLDFSGLSGVEASDFLNPVRNWCKNEAGEDLIGESSRWLPAGFLENWSSELAYGEDWII
ncbi:transcription factor MYB1-like [Punica granatum]|uniref:Uncharacterized protein n=2 Tax=Punica granatum TaxID=22663 RepID=A0A218XGM5_PUNGR|nr:transcription factor MYB1-like [Punica granatum]XP_031371490.1 transcription factor MYB1-like [Punica granatum]XP_031371491.1 transcription factor MYB1-like [Punica granatum]OWM84117.1 hypothetical protein CDL15_Pgr009364 [Punica granatum]PKI79015.1 hypothetical protein CRG98_000588 [Punica granatum]